MMKEELVKQLHERYPLIFERKTWCECGDGWYDLINTLCHSMQSHIDNRARQRMWAIEHNRKLQENPDYKPYDATPRTVPDEIDQVVVQQIKEKFGGLRFYCNGGSEGTHGMISLAEDLSYGICEECGNRGERRSGGWIRTLCDEHHVKRSLGAVNMKL